MQKVTENDHVTVTYEGMLSNGEVFESSEETGPLNFQLGTDSVMPGFEKGILGMTINETKTITLTSEESYGPRNEELIHTIERNSFGDNDIKAGMTLGMTVEKDGENHQIPATVTEIKDDKVTVDFNHPLAGQELTYQVTVRAIGQETKSDSTDCGSGCSASDKAKASCSPGGGCGC